MKKLFALFLMLVMVFAMTVSANAAPGMFLQSPSLNKTPIIIEYYNSNGECLGKLFVTSYGDRNVLDLVERENLESAYNSIVNSSTVSSLNPQISDIAANLNISPDNLAISDLFNINMENCFDHDEHGYFSVKLKADTLDHFVGLMYFEDGEWHIVEDAKIDGDCLIFTTDVPRAMAIVVDVDSSFIEVPVTGDVFSWILVSIMAASAAGIIVLVIVYRKKVKA